MSLQTAPLYLVEIVAWDPALATTRTLRYANRGYVTSASATPANTFYDERLAQPSDITRTMFSGASTRGRSTIALGDVILNNGDGLLDDLNELGFDGRTITVRRSTVFNPAYPADFTTIFVGSLEQPEFSLDTIRLKLRDRMYAVASAPFQTTTYAGSNVLPAGLEGTSDDLQGKVKPRCLGVVKNVAPPCVNTSKLIYQVNNGAIASLGAVYDRGVPLTVGRTWTLAGSISASTVSAVGFGGGIFVMVDSFGVVFTSSDGVTWTSRASGVGGGISVAYGNGTWLALTGTNTVTSTNGTSWSTHALPTPHGAGVYVQVCYFPEASLFVAVSNSGDISTTPNGTTWTHQVTGTFPTDPLDAYHGVAAGLGMVAVCGDGGRVRTSFDGVTWTLRTVDFLTTTQSFTGIAFGNDRFVTTCDTAIAGVSTDGITWTRVAIPAAAAPYTVYANLFINVEEITSTFLLSRDGIDWTTISGIGVFGANFITALATDGSIVVAFDAVGNGYYTATTSYASLADLSDDSLAPMPGEAKAYLPGGYFRLGGTPDGIVTADVTQGANVAARTGAQMFSSLVTAVGETPSAADVTAMDVANSHVLGIYVDSATTYDVVIDQIAGTLGAAWYPDASGVFRLKQLVAPTGTADLVITENDILSIDKVTSNDDGNGIPIHKVVVRWGRFYTTITTDIAGAVTDASRAQFANEWRDVESSDATVVTAHPSSQILTIESLYSVEADAQTESDRQLALRSVKRDTYEVTLELNSETAVIDINSVLEIQHPRFSLSVIDAPSGTRSGGGLFRVLDVRPNAKDKTVTFTVWGRSRYQNRATVADPVASRPLRVTTDGKYRIIARVA